MRTTGGRARVLVAAASLAAALSGARRAEAITFTDEGAGLAVDLGLPGARVCLLLPASLRDGAGCEGPDAEALSANVDTAAAAAVVREHGASRLVLVEIAPRARHAVARVEEAREFLAGQIEGITREGGRIVGNEVAARTPASLTVERDVQVMRNGATVAVGADVAALAQATLFGRDAFVTLSCETPTQDAAGARALLERVVARTTVTPPPGRLGWRPRPSIPSGPIVFRDAEHELSFDAQFPGARVCVAQPAELRTEAGCEDTDEATIESIRRPDLLFAARITDERGTRVLTVKAEPRPESEIFSNEDVDEFDEALRRELVGAGPHVEDGGVRATPTVERGVQVVRDTVLFRAADAGAPGDERQGLVVASFVARRWVISMILVTVADDVARSTLDLDRLVHSAEVPAPTGPHVWEPRATAVTRQAAPLLGGVLKFLVLWAAVIVAILVATRWRRRR